MIRIPRADRARIAGSSSTIQHAEARQSELYSAPATVPELLAEPLPEPEREARELDFDSDALPAVRRFVSEQALDAGFRDVFAAPGLKLAEWPEKAEGLLPEADLQIHIEPLEGDARRARFDARSARGVALIR